MLYNNLISNVKLYVHEKLFILTITRDYLKAVTMSHREESRNLYACVCERERVYMCENGNSYKDN